MKRTELRARTRYLAPITAQAGSVVVAAMAHISFEPFLQHLAHSPLGSNLATLSAQTKLEKFVLAAIAWGAKDLGSSYEFRLEEPVRRDLTLREKSETGQGRLVEWIEAKTCYSDCVARRITSRPRADEYSVLVAEDAVKQLTTDLLPNDRQASLTAAMFVFHHHVIPPVHIRRSAFNHRAPLAHSVIKREAIRYCVEEVSQASRRPVSEQFEIALDRSTELLCFFYSAQQGA